MELPATTFMPLRPLPALLHTYMVSHDAAQLLLDEYFYARAMFFPAFPCAYAYGAL